MRSLTEANGVKQEKKGKLQDAGRSCEKWWIWHGCAPRQEVSGITADVKSTWVSPREMSVIYNSNGNPSLITGQEKRLLRRWQIWWKAKGCASLASPTSVNYTWKVKLPYMIIFLMADQDRYVCKPEDSDFFFNPVMGFMNYLKKTLLI